MWKDYSADYMKNNRASGISIMAASLIAALLLSLLGSLFYNFWLDNIEGTKLTDGDWHGRITGSISEDDLTYINLFANVEKTVMHEEAPDESERTVDIYFYNKRTIYQDMNALIALLGLTEDAADYNYQLLSLYFIRIPGDEMPRMLMPAYLAVVALLCLSLILVIHNSFAVSMNSRIHQFGILSGIGATPSQIRTCLLQEAFMLSTVPILGGLLLGIAISFAIVRAMSAFATALVGGRAMTFALHPAVLALILLLSFFTVLISAWIPAGKLSRLTPLEAVRGTQELDLRKKKHSPVLSALFGIEGELAGNALKAQRKALRTTSLSLTLAFLGFMLMQCFFTLSGISTRHTYFEAYQDTWDVMITIKNTGIEELSSVIEKVQSAELVGNKYDMQGNVVYQKAEAVCRLPQSAQSKELSALGGIEAFKQDIVVEEDGSFLIEAPVVILDDESFKEFCRQIGISVRLDGAIALNRFWNSHDSNFRYPEYIPYVKEDLGSIVLQSADKTGAAASGAVVEIPLLACIEEPPLLREEYAKSDYPFIQFMPLSLWRESAGQIGGAEKDAYIRTLAPADMRTSLEALQALENALIQAAGETYEIESENRLQEKLDNDTMIRGYKLMLGGFCMLTAVIGIAHVFSHTLGFLRQRKREFARYLSIGLAPEGVCRMFCIEAAMVVGRPFLAALTVTIAAVAFMIRASYLAPVEFIRETPVLPISAFFLFVMGFVALAYYLGGKKILQVNVAESLRDDTML